MTDNIFPMVNPQDKGQLFEHRTYDLAAGSRVVVQLSNKPDWIGFCNSSTAPVDIYAGAVSSGGQSALRIPLPPHGSVVMPCNRQTWTIVNTAGSDTATVLVVSMDGHTASQFKFNSGG